MERPVRPGRDAAGRGGKAAQAIARAISQEQVVQRLNTAAADAVFSKSPQECAAYVRGENVRWGKIIRDSGLAAK